MDIYVEAQFTMEEFSINASFSLNKTEYTILEKNTTNIEVKSLKEIL